MNIAFRVDASSQTGIGHVMRCLTLADALSRHGARIRFVSRHLPDNLRQAVTARGYESAVLPPTSVPGDHTDVPHAHWLGTTQESDAVDSVRALSDQSWTWLVVDHYALGAVWENLLRGTVERILAIDDIADRVHACDVLLDQNYFAEGERRYVAMVPDACRLLVGPRYALLRPEYRAHRDVRPRSTEIRRVFVFFGGSDPHDLAGLALRALSDPRLSHLEVDVVSGSDPLQRQALDRQVAGRPGTRIHDPRPHLADLMAAADLALGSGGATTWERLCVGLPSLVITFADNQIPVNRWLAHEGLIGLIGHGPQVTVDAVRDAVLNEIERHVQRRAIDKGMELCDGLGVPRVVEALEAYAV